jgi:TadE-like protein
MRRYRTRDSGQASLELVGLIPLLLICLSFALQAGAVMWATSSTAEAARASARAYSLGQDPRVAAEGSLPGKLDVERLEYIGPGHGVRLTVEVPRISPLPTFKVKRQAVLP